MPTMRKRKIQVNEQIVNQQDVLLFLAREVKRGKRKYLKEAPQSSGDDGKEEKEEEVIKELENQGDLKKDVPVGGEEFENEEPRQGD